MTLPVTRDKAGKRQIEEAHQIALFDWIKIKALTDHRYDNIIAIPMGGKRSVRTAARLKAAGAKSGVSDIFVAVPMGHYFGLWIELKRPTVRGTAKAVASKEQQAWLERQRALGYGGVVCYGWEAAAAMITDYFQLK
jgi:hypothetical protein